MKELACKYNPQTLMLSLDDKCTVPLGEPELPQSTGVRPHHRSLGLLATPSISLDHDFHVARVVPSACVLVDIPGNSRDSFYDGTVHVTVKDKVFQPSTALRHTVETVKIIRKCRSPDDVNSGYPVLLEYTDGGPDHSTTFWTVKIGQVMKFIMLDLDLLVAARTTPSHSYVNMAERSMSLLNLALQHCALARSAMPEAYEKKMKGLSSVKYIRVAAYRDASLKERFMESTEKPISQIKSLFSRLQRKGTKVLMFHIL